MIFSRFLLLTLFDIFAHGFDMTQFLTSSYSQVSKSGNNQSEPRSSIGQTPWTQRSDAHIVRGQNLPVHGKNSIRKKEDKLINDDGNVPGKGEIFQERFNPKPWFGYEDIENNKRPTYTPPGRNTNNQPGTQDFSFSVPYDSFPLSIRPSDSSNNKPSPVLKPPFQKPDLDIQPLPMLDDFNASANVDSSSMNTYGSPFTSYNSPPALVPDNNQPYNTKAPNNYVTSSVQDNESNHYLPPPAPPPSKVVKAPMYLPPEMDKVKGYNNPPSTDMDKPPEYHSNLPDMNKPSDYNSNLPDQNEPNGYHPSSGKNKYPGYFLSAPEIDGPPKYHTQHQLPPEMYKPPKGMNNEDNNNDAGPPLSPSADYPSPVQPTYLEYDPNNHPNHHNDHPPKYHHQSYPTDEDDSPPPKQHNGFLPAYLEHDPHGGGHSFDHYLPHNHHPPIYHEIVTTTEAAEDQRLNKKPYSYYYIGRKLWYVPLYFSVYFIIYIFVLILKSIARHKITFNHYFEDDKREMTDMHEMHEEHVHELDDHIVHGMNAARRKYLM